MKANRGDVRSKKKKASRILRPDEKQKSQETIPVGLPAFERFYAGLLRSEANAYIGERKGLWESICSRLALPTPTGPLSSSYNTQQAHFSNRAALVIEEARKALSDRVRELRDERNSNHHRPAGFPSRFAHPRQSNKEKALVSMETLVTRVEHKGSGHSILTFAKKSSPFTKDEVHYLRQGTVFACLDKKTTHTIENMLLGVVLPQNRDEMISSNSFAVMLFRKIKKTNKGHWKLTPILSLLTEQRQFEACLNQMTTPVPFLLPLLGKKRYSHMQTGEDRTIGQLAIKGEAEELDENDSDSSSDCEELEFIDLESTFQIPRLNEMQERAATAFLRSKSDTISLVQGPPGTGKTTLLTAVICRYVIDSRKLVHNKRCLMVCAPTNKAITVLCSRFLNTFFDGECPCNVVLLGDEEKLFENEIRTRGNGTSEHSKLREIFLYTFIDAIKDEYLYVRNVLDKRKFGQFDVILKIVCRLKNLLTQKIADNGVIANAKSLEKLIKKYSTSRDKSYPTEIINKIDLILGMIGAWNRDKICQQVLQAADVVFCTLGSSGSQILKKAIGEIDDLIVDEAAAATEPEIYIPFQYLPRRLLCVGDPKQLPATITSQFAEKMGLSKSLHERLMYDCNFDHIMLDTQYRMKPALSQFPSENFYGGRLKNGRNKGRANMIGSSVYTLYQIDGKERQNRSGSIENESEANAVVEIVDNLRQSSRSSNWCSSNRLRIITFYQAQVSLIKHLLHRRNLGNVLVASVDSSQGCEADTVIISFVRSCGKSGKNTVGFVADDRRLNVALTRAKHQMICVGNIERMATLPDNKAGSVKRLAIDAFNRQCVKPFTFQNHASHRKRKTEQIEGNSCQRRSGNKSSRVSLPGNHDKTSDTSSGSGSDSESSFVSSSSSDSDSSTSDSSVAESFKPNTKANTLISTTERPNSVHLQATPPVDGLVPESRAPITIADENQNKKSFTEPGLLGLPVERKLASLDDEMEVTVGLDDVSQNVDRREESEPADNLVATTKQQTSYPSILSKTETMAVFENFSF